MDDQDGWVPLAQRIADDVLFPAAMAVERADRVPAAHLDLLAAEGFYGVAAPPEFGGVGSAGFRIVADVVAALAGGCLTTAFVWLQHLAPLMAVAAVAGERDRAAWLRPLATGAVRAGLAMARPDLIHVRPVPGGFRLSGESLWVTGWGLVNVLLVGAVDDRGLLHVFMMDATGSDSLIATDSNLLAVQASRTVSLRFADHFVPANRLGHTQPLDTYVASQVAGTVMNGFLALGVAGRCARLLGDAPDLESDVADARMRLLTATPDEVPDARANSSLLAARAAARLVVQTGSRSVLVDQHAGRLYRESGFLLVFGLRPAIKQAMLRRLSAPAIAPA
jgi:alkylation response protein AidB-like acyl-CoA dehydrogenase